jgi:hypothetical protein
MDSKILAAVIEDMRSREAKGKEEYKCTLDRTDGKVKYGTTMDREDLTTGQWITHLKQELQDAILYLTKLEQIHNAPQKDI